MADDVVACSYRLCAVCGQLFHDSYIRSNKPDGSKVLKCFPHCCPEHSRRRSCGTHLELLVHSDSADICVFARFEASLFTATLALGDSVPFLAGNVRTKEHTRGEWIACHRDASETPTMPVVCIINRNALEAEWAYGWTGSARVVDRQSTHHLVTYVFRCSLETPRLVVIGVARSPPFTITSARRASAAASVAWDDLEASNALSPSSGLTAFDFAPCSCGTHDLFSATYYR
ncbi:hypothetical protein SPRG_15192 [Saprolegnia parasitica CBS 223.65]|uniref:Uncharacterized protein n=1 Tax=Saprolegnia parasitica (strain CBS 223.65) TaxID=695850 RepID=A0A067BRX5_SAPPC|nr:hypothetical protein SPRG_15192 [Saprolegnia parasitica CBS 223.65]KDO19555.1 hypothetical protein SPRG_15192 [Saprolegnia parasitica CBS 223.65]|eukprot:XP_012209741.1 hypothetical protein SPRG_15192 [Saprolegnia parasitica CBS 223.65]